MQLDKLADMVVLTIKTALAPVLERVAAAEARLNVLGDLRDRVVTVETKAALSPAAPSVVFDAAPLLARLAALEDRVLVAETKANMPPVVPETKDVDLSPILERVSKLETKVMHVESIEFASTLSLASDLPKDIVALRERVAVAEVRALVPGPAGKDGANGADGLNGKDGVDGLGFDDVMVEHDGERGFTLKYARGERVKTAGTFIVPAEIYRGVYIDGKAYERGDCATWAGSEWHCNEATTSKPGDGSKAWTLKVKRGRDGRDGKDAEMPLPVLKVGVR